MRNGVRAIGTLAVAAALVGAVAGAGRAAPPSWSPVSASRSVTDQPRPLDRGKPTRLASALESISSVASSRGAVVALSEAATLGLASAQGELRVVVSAASSENAASAIRAAGGTVGVAAGPRVEGFVAPGRLALLASQPGVVYVAPPARPIPQSVGGQEVTATRAGAWQAAGITGAGVTVAILDAGFSGLAGAQANGDLPPSVTKADYCQGSFDTATVHGTAVAEIVHEIAPDAKLLLACVSSPGDLLLAERWASDQGAQIVNHSVAWFNTARGDGQGGPGTPDAVVADAAARGMLWVNAAGNSAQSHWSGVFTDADGDRFHDFAQGDRGNSVFVRTGSTFCAFLRWDEWSGIPADDFDLGIFRESSGTAVASSADVQANGFPPTESACYTPPAGVPDANYYVAIGRSGGTGTPRMDLWTFGGKGMQYQVAAGSVVDPAASPAALAAGAVCWQNGALEPFSSQGPTIDGRIKPDLVADDRMSSLTYGTFDSCSGTSGFAGTSASSPTLVGLAALVKQLYPSYSAAQLRSYLIANASNAGNPNPQSGAGRALLRPSLSTPQLLEAPSVTGLPRPGRQLVVLPGTWSGDGDLTFSYRWQRCDPQGANCGTPVGGPTYSVTTADIGQQIRLQVTASSAVGTSALPGTTTTQIPTVFPPLNITAPSVQGTIEVGRTLTAAEGDWDSPTATTFSYEWSSCAGGACTVVGSERTYTLVAADLGHQMKVAVRASNPDGALLASSALSATVQVAAPTGGGGGGGGGGGSAVANLGVTMQAKATTLLAGGDDELTVFVTNAAGAAAARETHLVISLPPAVTLLGDPYFERGSGCTGSPSLDCFLDYLPNGQTTRVVLEVRAASAGVHEITATVSAAGETDLSDNSVAVRLQVGGGTAPAPVTAATQQVPAGGKTISGTARADHLVGTPYNDMLNGLGGNDVLVGRAGKDVLRGGLGNDLIRARDGQRDVVDCGPGRDIAYVDRIDKVSRNCESIRYG